MRTQAASLLSLHFWPLLQFALKMMDKSVTMILNPPLSSEYGFKSIFFFNKDEWMNECVYGWTRTKPKRFSAPCMPFFKRHNRNDTTFQFLLLEFIIIFFNLSNNVAGRKNFAPTASHSMISIDRVTFYISLSSATSKLPGSLSNSSLKFFDQVIEQ